MNTITAQNIVYRENLTLKAQAVFIYLSDRSNKENICWPGLKRIASDCKISLSTVQRAIRELLKSGLVMKKPNFRENGSQTSNLYIVTENLQEKDKIKEENRRMQRKIEERMKRQARKDKLVEMFRSTITAMEQVDTMPEADTEKNNAKISGVNKSISIIKTFIKKCCAVKSFNSSLFNRGVVRKNTP